MQVYRGMDIGTAKPTIEERQGIPHHLIDIKNPDEEWTVSDFIGQTNKLINTLTNKKKTPIITGGTGLYLWALLEGFSFPIIPADKKLREQLEKEQSSELYSRLKENDQKSAEKIHPNDKKRIIRALEVYKLTGKPISQSAGKRATGLANSLIIGLNTEREKLYKRINQRVDLMIAKGLIDEVKQLMEKGFGKDLPSMQALGYKEVINYLEGKYSKEEMIEELKKRTRNFARRQMTWFKRFKTCVWFDSCAPSLINDIIKLI